MLLSVRDLTVQFLSEAGAVTAVDRVGFDVAAGEVLGIVGESGSGKSVTALSLLRLLPSPPARIAAGRAIFEGEDLLAMPAGGLRRVRGDRIAMIFQDPMTSLNPLLTIGGHVMEPLRLHRGLDGEAARRRAVELLDRVRIPSAARRLGDYPHQISGGMRQRVMIAAALACEPRLLIADEPTTALDVTIQAQILAILDELRRENGMAMILITHDLGVIAESADRVAVMYAGRIVEEAPVGQLFARPRHPYTEGLMRSIPRADRDLDRLEAIGGMVPPLNALPPGCRFHPRCIRAIPACAAALPELEEVAPDHRTACIRETARVSAEAGA
ncbi:MAG: ABC transporter ATP-binding protein [Alphaproteobacteria bacterium]|nr:ABC transporter ATP-binding protein [Alphaproteobacteria bacterium]